MRPTCLTLAAAAICAAGSSAGAVEEGDFDAATTGQLVNLCAATEGQPFAVEAIYFCYGYIEGMAALYSELVRGGGMPAITCPGDDVSTAEVAAQLVSWGRANPGKLSESAEDGLFEAAAARWPCP